MAKRLTATEAEALELLRRLGERDRDAIIRLMRDWVETTERYKTQDVSA